MPAENIASLSIPEQGTARLFGKWEYVPFTRRWDWIADRIAVLKMSR